MLLSAAAQPPRGWAHLVALAVAYVVFRVGSWVWSNVIKSPSPARALPGAKPVKVQATVGVNTDRTDDTKRGEVGWWGHIREIGDDRLRTRLRTGRAPSPGDAARDPGRPADPAE